jgi:hypothetical protein
MSRAIEQPQGERRDDEERDSPVGDEILRLVPDKRMAAERVVQQMKERPVDLPTLPPRVGSRWAIRGESRGTTKRRRRASSRPDHGVVILATICC